MGLVDCWTEGHQEEKGSTQRGSGPTDPRQRTWARLDRWLASTILQAWVQSAQVILDLIEDHLGVSFTLVARTAPARGPNMWRLPPWVISETEFRSLMETHIPAFWRDNPPIQGQHRQRWEHFKTSVRDASQSFTMARARQNRAVEAGLRAMVEAAYAGVCANPTCLAQDAVWQQARAALTTLRADRAREAAVKAGFLYEHLGERPTAWFHRLHKQRQAATTITHVSPPGAEQLVPLAGPGGKNAAEAAFTAFFSAASPGGMFAQRPVSPAAQDTLLASLDTELSAERQTLCDAPVSLDELHAALLGTAKNKAPGSDGLPFEFYRAFWHLLGHQLQACFQEAFDSPDAEGLPGSQRMGIITLLYKGKGLRRDQVASYRPITLLNTDYKIMARALACRWGPAADEVVDPTQTALIPTRWIVDNVLAHLEEIDFCQAFQIEGTILFIDSAKAYDLLYVGWLLRCLQHLGFGPNARRWVSLLHGNRQARVRYNGWRTAPFPIASGVAQGSPLSPLLYVLAAQPLAAHIRGLAVRGELRGIPLPDGSVAPYTHQHADDLTVHVASLADAQVVMHGPIRLFCEASGAEVHAGKAKGLHMGVAVPFQGVDAGTGILFAGSQESIRHLGILVGRDTEHCRQEMYTAIAASLERRVASWATTSLSYLGRTYVARQCMASKYTYHAAFVPAPPLFLRRTADLLATFVACGQRAGPGRPGANLYPNRGVSSLSWEQGGIRFPDTHATALALQASVVSRLFHPAQQRGRGCSSSGWVGPPSGSRPTRAFPLGTLTLGVLGLGPFSARQGCPSTPHRRMPSAGSRPGSSPTSGLFNAFTRTGRVPPLLSRRSWPSPFSTTPQSPADKAPRSAAHFGARAPKPGYGGFPTSADSTAPRRRAPSARTFCSHCWTRPGIWRRTSSRPWPQTGGPLSYSQRYRSRTGQRGRDTLAFSSAVWTRSPQVPPRCYRCTGCGSGEMGPAARWWPQASLWPHPTGVAPSSPRMYPGPRLAGLRLCSRASVAF